MKAELILTYFQENGPSVPARLAEKFGTDSIIIGAILSDLIAAQKLKVTKGKAGGSPLYFLPEHFDRIEKIYDYLNEKDKRTFDLLKNERVLRDDEQTPLVRASLSMLPDFAKPFAVSLNGQPVKFWRWYTLSDQDAVGILRERYAPKPAPVEKAAVESDKKDIEEKASFATPAQSSQESAKSSEPAQSALRDLPSDVKAEEGSFFHTVLSYLQKREVVVIEWDEVRKDSEADALLVVPTPLGKATYYCKVKKKKKINDGDISQAFVNGVMKRLPVCFLTNGELTKKCEESIEDMQIMFLRI